MNRISQKQMAGANRYVYRVLDGSVRCPVRGLTPVESCFYCQRMDSLDLDHAPPFVACSPDLQLAQCSPEEQVALERLHVIELAEVTGNISKACRDFGISRKQFYRYKQSYERNGLSGLQDHSHKVTSAVERRVVELSTEHPKWGCYKIRATLKQEGTDVSPPTVQHVLIRHGLGKRGERLAKASQGS
ncbi:helix-turn-helix domain-containing protein [Alicyclobacillus tolerans]|uniref:helix-turn-helix domain-containing protein n=1 Tax=Alicyclobacillus tolerans TaxID=90970 RepID=UPI001F219145|nr:helix-turn-helix domain-containing protein [Alicyclobacillus tolerans]MCF8564077.1 helix-turn-helix domain-containing protein [Alicyclobacillus tolerans]